MVDKIDKSDAEWARELTAEEFRITREQGTERAFTGKYWDTHADGVYKCRCCGEPLFDSSTKFDSGTGWPSFFAPLSADVVAYHLDTSYGMQRVETTCNVCDAH